MPSTNIPIPGLTAIAVGFVVIASLLASVPATPRGPAGQAAATAEDDLAVAGDSFETARGGLVELPIRVPANRNVTLLLQRTPNAVTSRAVVRDGGDGEVVVVLNTFDGTWSVRNDTDRIVSQDTNPGRVVRASAYHFSISTEDDAAHARIDVTPRSLNRFSTWRATASTPPFENATTIRRAIEAGDVGRAESLQETDTLVLALHAPGLEGAVAAMPGENASARVRHLFESLGALHLNQTNPAPERPRATVPVLDSPGVEFHPDAPNGTYYVTLDLSTVHVLRGEDRDTDFRWDGAEFAASATLVERTNLTDELEHRLAYVEPRRARLPGGPHDTIRLSSTSRERIKGRTTVGAGWNVTVVVRGTDDGSTAENESFVRRTSTRIRTNGTDNEFVATVDLDGISPGTDASVDVRFQNASLLESPRPASIEATTTEGTTTEPTATTTTTHSTTVPTTTTQSTNPTPTDSGQPGTTGNQPDGDGETGIRVPGPGPLGIAVALFGAFVLLAGRRQD